MIWATRRGVHVDRAACAWLLRRFVDPQARFVFVDDPAEVPDDATPFDMRGVELGHHAGDCTFETMLRHFENQRERRSIFRQRICPPECRSETKRQGRIVPQRWRKRAAGQGR